MKTTSLLLALALPMAAQSIQPVAPAHTPDGASYERIESITILPKPGAPFTATVVTEWKRTLEDGSKTIVKNHRTVARDSLGRIFQERRVFTPDGDTAQTRVFEFDYFDPVRHEKHVCVAATHLCTVSPWSAPTEVAPVRPVSENRTAEVIAHMERTDAARAEAAKRTGAPPPAPNPAIQTLKSRMAVTVTREDIGEKNIENLQALGSREITTVPGEKLGYATPEPTIKEFWFSPRLEVNLVVRRFEPRGGAQDFVMKDINLNEPDPRTFQPPQGYKTAHTVIE